MADLKHIDRSSKGAPVFSWDAPEVFLRLGLDEQRASLEVLKPEQRETWLRLLDEDPRKGRRNLAKSMRRKQERQNLLEARLYALRNFDVEHAEGRLLAGVDEVGRGPLAGPVTAAAVILAPNFHAPGLDDSKRLSAEAREKWDPLIREQALAWAVADLPADSVDELGIRECVFRVMRMALADLDPKAEIVLVDGREIPPGMQNAKAIIDGDARSLSVAAASVIAKVHRDAIMRKFDSEYPGYDFAGNKGYGSASHLQALREKGPCPLHRRSFLGRILADSEEVARRSR